jgi:hypothetical protein
MEIRNQLEQVEREPNKTSLVDVQMHGHACSVNAIHPAHNQSNINIHIMLQPSEHSEP